MKLLTITVATLVISMVFDQTATITEARKLRKSSDDFVPSSPSNRPTVGYKKGNANVEGSQDDFKPSEGRKLQKTNGEDHFKTGRTDDFAPTLPGNSPGVGHKKGNANVERLKDDFKPTEGRRSQKANGRDYFKTGSTDDFAPTSPGNSPGMGHKKGDDFKPTTPGHSPGIGHDVKNDEPTA